MYCKHCGKQVDDDSTFCKFCGKEISEPQPNQKCVKCGSVLPKESISNVCPTCAMNFPPNEPNLNEKLKRNYHKEKRSEKEASSAGGCAKSILIAASLLSIFLILLAIITSSCTPEDVSTNTASNTPSGLRKTR